MKDSGYPVPLGTTRHPRLRPALSKKVELKPVRKLSSRKSRTSFVDNLRGMSSSICSTNSQGPPGVWLKFFWISKGNQLVSYHNCVLKGMLIQVL